MQLNTHNLVTEHTALGGRLDERVLFRTRLAERDGTDGFQM